MTIATPPPLRLPTHEAQSQGFHRLQWRLLRTRLAQGLATSRLRYGLVVSLSVMLWCGLYYLVEDGFHFMKTTLPLGIHNQIVQGIFNSFFSSLFSMLIFSASVILYGSLFRSGEVAYLLTLPVHEERIFQHQFQHAVLLSSWGFVLLGSPMMVAYGRVAEAPWYYYAALLPMLVAFVFIPAGFGAILLMAIMYFFPRKRMHVLGLAFCAAVIAAVWFFWSLVARPETELLTPRWFVEMLRRLQMTQEKPLPNWWLSSGLLETAARDWSEGLLFLVLLIANALFVRELAGFFAARIYRPAYWATMAVGSRPARRADGLVRPRAEFLLAVSPTPGADDPDERSATLPPRSAAMVAVPYSLRPAGPLLHQRPPGGQRAEVLAMGEHRQLHEPLRGRPADVDLHHALRLSHGQHRGPLLLAAGPAAAETRHGALGQVPLLGLQPAGPLWTAGAAERLPAGRAANAGRRTPGDLAPVMPGIVGHWRRPGGPAAVVDRTLAGAHRRRVRRHVEPGHQHALYRRHARAASACPTTSGLPDRSTPPWLSPTAGWRSTGRSGRG